MALGKTSPCVVVGSGGGADRDGRVLNPKALGFVGSKGAGFKP